MSYGADRSYFLVVVKHVLPHNGGPVECAGDVHYTEGEDERRSKVNGHAQSQCLSVPICENWSLSCVALCGKH